MIGLILRNVAYCADDESAFLKLNSDIAINGTSPISVLSQSIYLSQTKKILIEADGRYYPNGINGIAGVNIRVDGNDVGNYSIINWQSSSKAAQHSFNCISLIELPSGQHTFQLVGYNHPSTSNGKFIVGAGSGLSILINPSPFSISTSLSSDSETINFTTQGIDGYSPVPTKTILTNYINNQTNTPVISLASGRVYKKFGEGDALLGIYSNNDNCISNGNST